MAKGKPRASLESFLASCPEMLFIAGVDGKLITWSDALGAWLGPALTQGASFEELAHDGDRGALASALARARDGAGAVQLRARFRGADGQYKELVGHARRSPEGDELHGALREPAETIATEIKEKARFLDSIAQNLAVALWMIDADGTFTYHDGKVLEPAGMPPGYWRGKNAFELYGDQIGMPFIRRALQGETLHHGDFLHGRDWENWYIPNYDEQGVVRGLFGISIDVSDAKQAQRELQDRLEQISKQQEVIRNLSTPIIEVWNGVLTLPMVGVVDSIRTAEVMDSLLDRIVSTQARYAILDLTGVEVVDTRVASHLLQLINAIRLLGAEGIVAGIKPTVAQTMVALGLDLTQIITQRNLRASLSYCIRRMNAQDKPAPQPAAAR